MHGDSNNFLVLGGMAQAMMRIQTHLVRTQIIEENIKSQKNLAIKSLVLQRNRRKRKIEGLMLHHQGITGSECNISCTYIHAIVPVDSIHSNYTYCARTGAK